MARPKGSTTTPQFKNYVTDKQRLAFVAWVEKNYKKNPKLATWYGDQMFGRAVQPLGNDNGEPLKIAISGMKIVKEWNGAGISY